MQKQLKFLDVFKLYKLDDESIWFIYMDKRLTRNVIGFHFTVGFCWNNAKVELFDKSNLFSPGRLNSSYPSTGHYHHNTKMSSTPNRFTLIVPKRQRNFISNRSLPRMRVIYMLTKSSYWPFWILRSRSSIKFSFMQIVGQRKRLYCLLYALLFSHLILVRLYSNIA